MSENIVNKHDLTLYRKMQDSKRTTDALVQFVSSHLAEAYELGQHDTFDLITGAITRGGQAQALLDAQAKANEDSLRGPAHIVSDTDEAPSGD